MIMSTTTLPGAGMSYLAQMPYSSVGNSFTGTISKIGASTVPNNNTMCPAIHNQEKATVYSYRPTAMGVRVVYLGTELNRAGQVSAGLVQSSSAHAASAVTNGVSGNPINIAYGFTYNTLPNLGLREVQARFKRSALVRAADGAHEFHWIPMGTPKFQPIENSSDPVHVDEAVPSLIIAILGDHTEAPSLTGNTWQVEVRIHWEVIPGSSRVLVSTPTPSACDFSALQTSINGFALLSSAFVEGGAGLHSVQDGRQTTTPSAYERLSGIASGAQDFLANISPAHRAETMRIASGLLNLYGRSQGLLRNRNNQRHLQY